MLFSRVLGGFLECICQVSEGLRRVDGFSNAVS
jgi:hypothetical protein